MSNILAKTKQPQIEGLERIGWSLRKIEAATGVRRETISGDLAAAGIPVRRRGGRVADWPPPHPATTAPVSTGPDRGFEGLAATPISRTAVLQRAMQSVDSGAVLGFALASR